MSCRSLIIGFLLVTVLAGCDNHASCRSQIANLENQYRALVAKKERLLTDIRTLTNELLRIEERSTVVAEENEKLKKRVYWQTAQQVALALLLLSCIGGMIWFIRHVKSASLLLLAGLLLLGACDPHTDCNRRIESLGASIQKVAKEIAVLSQQLADLKIGTCTESY